MAGLEPGTFALGAEDLSKGLQCYYAYGVGTLAIYKAVYVLHSISSQWKQLWNWNKNQNVANKQMKATIIVLNATLSRLLYKIVVCQHKKDSL